VGYTQGVLAEDLPKVRKSAQLTVDHYNELFERAFELRFRDSNFRLFNLKGFVPQVLDEEDPNNLIPPIG
jgi:hypothetical protein